MKIYWCSQCKWGQFHPLTYCKLCPGKLIPREIFITEKFQTEKDLVDYLYKHNIIYKGEYPEVSKEKEKQILIERYKNKLLEAYLKCIFYSPDGNYHPYRSVNFWLKEIQKLEKGE